MQILGSLLVLTFLIMSTGSLSAQPTEVLPYLDKGKMWVVLAVIAAIFAGLVSFLFYLDRKLTKLENQIKNHE
ncbi:MAG: CcmD family protein [Bacteroidota bacterium]|jgi:CcmD family protein